MKKKLMACLVIIGAISLALTGCSRGEAKRAAEGFLQGIIDGDMDAISNHASAELMESGELSFSDRELLAEQIYEQLSVQKDDLGEDAQTAIDDYINVLVRDVIKSYKITSVKIKDGVATVEADIVRGFDPNAELKPLEDDTVSEDIAAYQSEHYDELVEIYNKSGESAMRRELINGIVPIVLGDMTKRIEAMEDQEAVTTITVQKIEKEWKVTGFDEVYVPVESSAGSSTGEASAAETTQK